jgi:hypothetical protein
MKPDGASQVIHQVFPHFNPLIWPAVRAHLDSEAESVRKLLAWFALQGRRAAAAGAPPQRNYAALVCDTPLGAACLVAYAQGHQDETEAMRATASCQQHSSTPGPLTPSTTSPQGTQPELRGLVSGGRSRRRPGRPGRGPGRRRR